MNLTSWEDWHIYWFRYNTSIYLVHADNSSAYIILENVIDNTWRHVQLYIDGKNKNINKQIPNRNFTTIT